MKLSTWSQFWLIVLASWARVAARGVPVAAGPGLPVKSGWLFR